MFYTSDEEDENLDDQRGVDAEIEESLLAKDGDDEEDDIDVKEAVDKGEESVQGIKDSRSKRTKPAEEDEGMSYFIKLFAFAKENLMAIFIFLGIDPSAQGKKLTILFLFDSCF